MAVKVPFLHVLHHGAVTGTDQAFYDTRPLPNERRTYEIVSVENRTTDGKYYSLGVRAGGQSYELDCVLGTIDRPEAFQPMPITIPEGLDAQLFVIGAALVAGDNVTYIALGYSEFIEAD